MRSPIVDTPREAKLPSDKQATTSGSTRSASNDSFRIPSPNSFNIASMFEAIKRQKITQRASKVAVNYDSMLHTQSSLRSWPRFKSSENEVP